MTSTDHDEAIDHDEWCHQPDHTDPELPCASKPVTIHGVTSFISRTADGPRAFVGRIPLDAGMLGQIIDRLIHLRHLLLR